MMATDDTIIQWASLLLDLMPRSRGSNGKDAEEAYIALLIPPCCVNSVDQASMKVWLSWDGENFCWCLSGIVFLISSDLSKVYGAC